MADHPKSNSTGGFPRPLGPPCTNALPTHIFSLLPPVEVDEGEGERDVERRQLGGAAAPLARLEGDHQVDVAGGTLRAEVGHQLGPEHVTQQILEALVHGCGSERRFGCCEDLVLQIIKDNGIHSFNMVYKGRRVNFEIFPL